ncbi:hypothetical protein P5673_008459 [Acropora cervicornis]|uniref:Uncharacterized protein n=1 Tax=Acropora cervicornis TaxID=6130 RepID=A0AAD9QUF2_ACRCE|nr:hypothetical protein P5673_008459 [Acropora cervicornis]
MLRVEKEWNSLPLRVEVSFHRLHFIGRAGISREGVLVIHDNRKLLHNSYLQHYLSDVCLYVVMCRIKKIDERFGIFARGGNDSLYNYIIHDKSRGLQDTAYLPGRGGIQ